jgi:hypothetical protein
MGIAMAETAVMCSEEAKNEALSESAEVLSKDTGRRTLGLADSALGAVGAKLVDAARALNQKTAWRGGSGVASPLILALQDAGFFLQGRPTEKLLHETESVLRRRPIPFILIGATLGFLLARGTRR